MSLKPATIEPVPEQTARIARAAFPKGNAYVTLGDELGTLYRDDDFAGLFGLCSKTVWVLLSFRDFQKRISHARFPV